MTDQNSAVALRTLIVSALTGVDGDSLDQVNTSKLPNGATVYVNATKKLYRLAKSSELTIPSGSSSIVQPDGGPGQFILANGAQAAGQAIQTAALTGATAGTDDTWAATPAGANFYAQVGDGLFTVAPDTGVFIYRGPDGSRVLAEVLLSVASAVASQSFEVCFTINGFLIGTTTAQPFAGVANVSPTTAGLVSQISCKQTLSLNEGDTFQPVIRDTSASNNFTVSRVNVTAIPLF